MEKMHEVNAEVIGARLRDLRGNRPQKEIADAAHVSTMMISKYERGESVPGDDVKIALAKLFNVTVESIFFTF
jgi:putative transcriptional regulator